MLKRMWGMLKFAGEPLPYYGSMGNNITSRKTLPHRWQGTILAAPVNLLGMVQSVFRYLALPLIIGGLWFSLRRHKAVTWLLLATVLYYLVIGASLHMEIRYGLAMQSLLLIFAAICIGEIGDWVLKRRANLKL